MKEEEEVVEEENKKKKTVVEYGPTTGCDASLSRIEPACGSKFTESGGQFLRFALLFFFYVWFPLEAHGVEA